MTKTEAIELFGSGSELARALNISRQAISQWQETLTQEQVDRIIGAALRTGRLMPVTGAEPAKHSA